MANRDLLSKGRVLGGLALVVGLALPASSPAAVTIGSSVAGNGAISLGCSGPTCTLSQTALPGRTLQSPVAGRITTWRVGTANTNSTLHLRVLRPIGSSFLFVSSGPPRSFTAAQAGLQTIPVDLPIAIGDRIGVNISGSGCCVMSQNNVPGAVTVTFQPSPADGSTVPPTATFGGQQELILNADVEPTNTFTAAQARTLKDGSAEVTATLPNAGTLAAAPAATSRAARAAKKKKKKRRAPFLEAATATATGPGPLTLILRPSKATKAKLKRKGKASGAVNLTFTPSFGTASVQTLPISLKPKRGKKKKKK